MAEAIPPPPPAARWQGFWAAAWRRPLLHQQTGLRSCCGSRGSRGTAAMVQQIIREEGLKGLYRGVVINVQRAALVNLGELSTYDQAKTSILEHSGLRDGVAVHTLSACCSGLVASVCATPADVVKSRVMAGQASGVLSCVQKTVSEEGLWALWKGFFPNWARLGPWQLVFWITYEHSRQAMGYGGF